MAEVRDSTIDHWRQALDGRMQGAGADEVQRLLVDAGADERRVLRLLLPRIVGATLHYLLTGLENSPEVTLSVKAVSGDPIDLCDASDGLAGELRGEHGWVVRFSKERA